MLTLEAGLGEKHQLEFFVEYHDGLRQLLDFEPVAMLEKGKYWLEQFFDSESLTHLFRPIDSDSFRIFIILGVVKFIETVAGNEVNADTFDTQIFDEIKNCLEKIIKEVEATNPKAAISEEPFTVWEIISGLMNLEKINLDASLQVSSRACTNGLSLISYNKIYSGSA